MKYTTRYMSPVGQLLLASDGEALTGLWIEGAKYFADGLDPCHVERELPVFDEAAHWLDIYFSGREPVFTPPLHLEGSPFRRQIWEILLRIPYGTVTTYGEISKMIRGNSLKASAQAVGGAVGHNPVSIIVPCHRVIGTNGSLTGYAGGIDKKRALLTLEGAVLQKAGL